MPAELAVTRASSGTVLELAFDVTLEGPCFRCLADAELAVALSLREYEATKPESDDEQTEYLVDDRLDLSAWAHDAIVLALPEQDPRTTPTAPGSVPSAARTSTSSRTSTSRSGRPALGRAQRASRGMTNGVVVVSGTKPTRSRIGRLVGNAST